MSRTRPLIIAHRGASGVAPENTLAAARAALDAGADMWEVDVTVTADGELILMHDDTLTRTTDAASRYPDRAPWAVSDFTAAEIATLDAGSWFTPSPDSPSFAGEHVPTLREALLFTREHHWRINVELKALPPDQAAFPLVDAVLALVHALGMEEEVLISSFVHDYLREIQRKAPRVPVAALIGCGAKDQVDWETLMFPTYNLCALRAPQDWIRRLRAAGRGVNVWVVNDISWMRYFIDQGVTGIFTDYPGHLYHLLEGE